MSSTIAKRAGHAHWTMVPASTILFIGLLSGCAPDVPTNVQHSGEHAAEYVFEDLQARTDSVDVVSIEEHLAELLPNHLFAINDTPAAPLAAGVVFGEVSKVAPGRAFTVEGDDADSGTAVAFDSDKALWRTLDITVDVSTALGKIDSSQPLHIGVVIDGSLDTEAAVAGYSSLGSVVMVLNSPGKFGYDPSLYSIRQSGALLGTVTDTGEISFPALGDAETEFLGELTTQKMVVEEAHGQESVVQVEFVDGIPVRK